MRKFTKDHEWIDVDGDTGTVGITDYAQEQLGDVVFVEPPEAGAQLSAGGEAGVVESVKAASEIYSPVSGEVTEGNAGLADAPDLLNNAPDTDGWIFRIKLSDPAELAGLMNEDEYQSYIEGLD